MPTTFLNRNGFRLLPANLGEIVLFCRLLLQHSCASVERAQPWELNLLLGD